MSHTVLRGVRLEDRWVLTSDIYVEGGGIVHEPANAGIPAYAEFWIIPSDSTASGTFDWEAVAIDPDTATPDADFTPLTGTALLGQQETEGSVSVSIGHLIQIPILFDELLEPDETFRLVISDATGDLQITNDTGHATIVDTPTSGHVELVEAFGYSHEGDDMTFVLKASTTVGTISLYEVDINRDGIFDVSTSEHHEEVGGALLLDIPLLYLLGTSVEEGTYLATVRVTNTQNVWQDFDFEISVGNTPPAILASGYEYTQPGEVFSLSVSMDDPGPDTVTSLVVAWGDGTSNSYNASGGSFDHVYATDGIYTILITATDEDGTWSIEHRATIGATDAAYTESELPQVISALAEILPSGDAEVTIEAVDSQGNPIASIHWDLDGDGEFEYAGGETATLPPQSGFYPYVARVRLIDSLGNSSETMIAFLGAGPADVLATIANYRANFMNLTPDMPTEWQVHHTLQVGRHELEDGTIEKILADRFLKEKGINVHDPQYLRGVPKDVHDEITIPLKLARGPISGDPVFSAEFEPRFLRDYRGETRKAPNLPRKRR